MNAKYKAGDICILKMLYISGMQIRALILSQKEQITHFDWDGHRIKIAVYPGFHETTVNSEWIDERLVEHIQFKNEEVNDQS